MFRISELNKQLTRLDLGADDMSLDDLCVLDFFGCLEVRSNSVSDHGLDFMSRNSWDGAGLLGLTLQQSR